MVLLCIIRGKTMYMYLSYVNDFPDKEDMLLAVVIDNKFLESIKKIKENTEKLVFPYPVQYSFHFPTDNVRLFESGDLDELVEDKKEYQSWERGGEDPLDYYRFQVHLYEPKEDFWYANQPESASLKHSFGNRFGFDAYCKGKIYYGYEFDWNILK